MSRVLAYTSPAHGHLFPLVPTLDELRRRRHDVTLRTLAAEVRAMRSRGFEAAPITPAVETLRLGDERARTPLGAIRHSSAALGARAALDAADLRRAIAEEQPDGLIVDISCWGALAAAEAWGGPWACFCPHPLPLPSRQGPPFTLGLAPARGALGRLRDRLVAPLVEAGFDQCARGRVNAVRQGLGLAPLAHASEMLTAAPLLLYMSIEPFEYPRPDWPESVVMIGPCASEPPGELPPDLAGVETPLVLVTTSSEPQNDHRLVAAALEALAGEALHVVATMPTARMDGPHGSSGPAAMRLPPNATILEFSPHTPILEHCACAITHGGMGVTQKALVHGVPVCAVPFGRDQLEVARRVEVAGAGTRLAAWRLSPGRLAVKVREAIARRGGAERMASAFAAAGGPIVAADAFERLLRLN